SRFSYRAVDQRGADSGGRRGPGVWICPSDHGRHASPFGGPTGCGLRSEFEIGAVVRRRGVEVRNGALLCAGASDVVADGVLFGVGCSGCRATASWYRPDRLAVPGGLDRPGDGGGIGRVHAGRTALYVPIGRTRQGDPDLNARRTD